MSFSQCSLHSHTLLSHSTVKDRYKPCILYIQYAVFFCVGIVLKLVWKCYIQHHIKEFKWFYSLFSHIWIICIKHTVSTQVMFKDIFSAYNWMFSFYHLFYISYFHACLCSSSAVTFTSCNCLPTNRLTSGWGLIFTNLKIFSPCAVLKCLYVLWKCGFCGIIARSCKVWCLADGISLADMLTVLHRRVVWPLEVFTVTVDGGLITLGCDQALNWVNSTYWAHLHTSLSLKHLSFKVNTQCPPVSQLWHYTKSNAIKTKNEFKLRHLCCMSQRPHERLNSGEHITGLG